MEKELTFNNHKFEKAVRESLTIKEAPITTTLKRAKFVYAMSS